MKYNLVQTAYIFKDFLPSYHVPHDQYSIQTCAQINCYLFWDLFWGGVGNFLKGCLVKTGFLTSYICSFNYFPFVTFLEVISCSNVTFINLDASVHLPAHCLQSPTIFFFIYGGCAATSYMHLKIKMLTFFELPINKTLTDLGISHQINQSYIHSNIKSFCFNFFLFSQIYWNGYL